MRNPSPRIATSVLPAPGGPAHALGPLAHPARPGPAARAIATASLRNRRRPGRLPIIATSPPGASGLRRQHVPDRRDPPAFGGPPERDRGPHLAVARAFAALLGVSAVDQGHVGREHPHRLD